MPRLAIFIAITSLLSLVLLNPSYSHDQDHSEWDYWFNALKMPDNPMVSCCGKADAYWADSFEIVDKRFYAIVTDTRSDNCCYGNGIMGNAITRRHIPVGTRIYIPDRKLVDATKQGNPTGHGWVFVGPGDDNSNLYCYVMPGGV